MIGAGKLNKRVTIHKRTMVEGGVNGTKEAWVRGATIFANVTWVSSNERYASQSVGVQTLIRIIIRKADVSLVDRIEHAGEIYQITSIMPSIKDETFLTLTVGNIKQ